MKIIMNVPEKHLLSAINGKIGAFGRQNVVVEATSISSYEWNIYHHRTTKWVLIPRKFE